MEDVRALPRVLSFCFILERVSRTRDWELLKATKEDVYVYRRGKREIRKSGAQMEEILEEVLNPWKEKGLLFLRVYLLHPPRWHRVPSYKGAGKNAESAMCLRGQANFFNFFFRPKQETHHRLCFLPLMRLYVVIVTLKEFLSFFFLFPSSKNC